MRHFLSVFCVALMTVCLSAKVNALSELPEAQALSHDVGVNTTPRPSTSVPLADGRLVSSLEPYTVSELLTDLHYPKAIESVDVSRDVHHASVDGEAIVIAERDGSLVILSPDGKVLRFPVALEGLYTRGQGGVIDILFTGSFADTGLILISYSKGDDDANKLAVIKAKLSLSSGVTRTEKIFEIAQSKDTPVHFGGKMVELTPGHFLITSGDGFDYREQAQRLQSHLGKVLGFTLQGDPLSAPPFPNYPYVFSLGHRNPQGLVLDNLGQIYQHEHGPDGGDEFNILTPGQNYGWPVVTLGTDYSGARISPFTEYPGMVAPLVDWTPSIAPSSMIYYTKDAFPSLKNTFLVTSLKAKQLYSVRRYAEGFVSSPVRLQLNQRLRDIASDNLGNLIILTDGQPGRVVKVAAQGQ